MIDNVFIKAVEGRFDLPRLTKPSNCIIIEIDGLDACGKETFSKSLRFELEKVTSNAFSLVEIERISFPDYEGNIYAGEIYKELRRDIPLYSREQLDGLYFLDRYYTMKGIYEKCIKTDVTYIFILDRYMLSNCIYTHLPFIGQDEKTLNRATKSAYTTLQFEVDKIGGIDYLAVIYIPNDEKAINLHHNLIESKRNREEADNNETFEKQDFLAEILRERILFNTPRFTQKLLYPYVSSNNTNVFRIPIGSTFNGNIEWEEKIINQLLPRFKTREEMSIYETDGIDEFALNIKYRPVIRLLENVEIIKESKDDIDLTDFDYTELFSKYYDGEVLYLKDMMPKVIPIVAFIPHAGFNITNDEDNESNDYQNYKEYDCVNVRLDLAEYKGMIKYDSKFSKEIIGKEFETHYYPIDGYHVRFHKSNTDNYLSVKLHAIDNKVFSYKAGLLTIGYVMLERV